MKKDFFVVIPILKPTPIDSVGIEIQEYFLNEINALKGSFTIGDLKIEYEIAHNIERYSHITQRIPPPRFRPYQIFIFQMITSKASLLPTAFVYEKNGIKLTEEQSFIFSVFHDLSVFGYVLAYALGIYCKGLFDIDDFVVYHDDANLATASGILNSFSSFFDKKDLYEQTNKLSLQKTLDWFLSIKDVLNACGNSALGKSLSIYSRMFSTIGSDDDIFLGGFLSFVALEALYESHGKINDLSAKMASYLNIDEGSCKKDVKTMYKHRSSVAHGGFEFPFKFNPNDASENFEMSLDKTWETYNLGLRYLFESYRKMIRENQKELSFT